MRLAVAVAADAEAYGAADLFQKGDASALNLCLHFAPLLVVSTLSQEGEHVVVVLFQTVCLGTDDGLRGAIGRKRAQGGNAVQNAADSKVLQAVLRDEAEGLEVYHNK